MTDFASFSTQGWVFSYRNPDTDGVACALAYSLLKTHAGMSFVPLLFGELSAETQYALSAFECAAPKAVIAVPDEGPIVLVDTHQLRQMPVPFDPGRVIEIIDHHPDGDPKAFPFARIQNELVGAAATLLVEAAAAVDLPRHVAGMLAAAIVSNTLNFEAPSTTERDHRAFTNLNTTLRLPETFGSELLRARDDLLRRSTREILEADAKSFDVGGVEVRIAQLELASSAPLLTRVDLLAVVEAITEEISAAHYLINIVDLSSSSSVLIAANPRTQALIARELGGRFEAGRAHFDRILLRKTDLVPAMSRALLEQA